MDDLGVSGKVVRRTLRELDVINLLLGGNQISIRAFRSLIRGKKHVKVADLGCGSGELLRLFAQASTKIGVPVQLFGFDANPFIAAYATSHVARYQNIKIESLDICSLDFAEKQFDIIHCCLFTHHFTDDQLVKLLHQFKRQARIGVIINDLHRHPLAYYSIRMLTQLFSRSYLVKADAPRSVERGFRRAELEKILKMAGIKDYTLNWRWAFRWQLVF